jgi:ribose transport system permease protein
MSQPDVTGAGGPAGPPSSQAGAADAADGAPGPSPGADAAKRARRPAGAARIRPPADLPARLRRAAIVFPFLILFVVLSVASGPFFTKVNLLDILDQQAATLIIAAAGTLVLVAGGIDLSVGAIYALAGVTAAHLALSAPPAVAILAGLAVGLVVGLVNGVVTTFFRINSLIATLAMSFVVAGLASLVTGGNLIILYSHPSFGDLARTSFLSVNTSTWIMVIAVVLLTIVLARTTAGRYMYAAGGNAEAARLAGVRVQLIKVVTFVVSGGAAALGGLIDTSRVLSAQASNGETALTFTVLAGIVVGGTSILGGEGGIWRTVVGVLFIALIGNGFDLLGLNPLYEQITLGAVLLIAVGIDAWSRLRTA